MALVTRCPECATLFKIVPDQLRISEGWVRCGHCNEVFDASVDLHQQPNEALVATPVVPLAASAALSHEPPAPQPWKEAEEPDPAPLHLEFPEPPQLSQVAAEPARDHGRYDAHGIDLTDHHADVEDDSETSNVAVTADVFEPHTPMSVEVALEAEFDRELQALEDESAAAEWSSDRSVPPASTDHGTFSTDLEDDGFHDEVAAEDAPAFEEADDAEVADEVESDSVEPSVPDMPSMGEDAVFAAPFVSTAVEEDEATGASSAAAALPLVAAPVQASSMSSASATSVHDYAFLHGGQARNSIWRQPAVRYALMGLSVLLLLVLGLQWLILQREVVAAHWPQSRAFLVSVCEPLGCSVSPLRRIDTIAIDSSAFTSLRRGAYRLNVVLKNRGPYPLAVPSIELALTDSQEQAVIRRVIPPHEMGVHAETIDANGELVAAVELAVPDNDAATRIVGYRLLAFYP